MPRLFSALINNTRKLMLAAAVCLLAGCTTFMTLEPGAQAKATYEDGLPTIVSKGEFSTVQVMPAQHEYQKGQRIGVWVNVSNLGPESFAVDSTDVAAADGFGALRVWTYDERMKQIRREAAWAAVAAGMAAGANSANAAMQQNTATTYGNVGNTSFNSTTYYTDYSAQMRADAENRRNMENLAARIKSDKEAAQLILKKNTVQPGASVTGYLLINAPKGEPGLLDLSISVGPDVHGIHYRYVRKE